VAALLAAVGCETVKAGFGSVIILDMAELGAVLAHRQTGHPGYP
jgi:hypothetical protein